MDKKKLFKLILGLGNENLEQIEKLVTIYAKAGADIIDIAPSKKVYELVEKLAPNAKICVSVAIQGDRHGQKARIDEKSCNLCRSCIKKCPQKAIFLDKNTIRIESKSCIGCRKCSCFAIKFEDKNTSIDEVIALSPDIIELHASTNDKKAIKSAIAKITSSYTGEISLCISREHFSDSELKKIAEDFISSTKQETTIQADGVPMSGGNDSYASTLQAVATADIFKNIKTKIIISGGTNSKTAKLAKLCSTRYNGIAIGSFARKIVQEETSAKNFFTNENLQTSAINKAKALIESIKNVD